MTATAQVAIIGAGPYGLSVAAHLSARGLQPIVFGRPMSFWRNGVPRGMRLKSEGFATSLSDPQGKFTLKAFCEEENLPYADINLPIPFESFVAYGDAFQKRFVPQVDTRLVQSISAAPGGFTLQLEDGAELHAERVVVAAGITPYRHIPETLAALPPARLSHSADRTEYTEFAGAKVMVVGAGASATDIAASLHAASADVAIVCRGQLRFYPGGKARRWFDHIFSPMTPVGPGWKKWLIVSFPLLFHRLPEPLRVALVKRVLRPAPSWFMREAIEGKVPVLPGCEIVGARETPNGAAIELKHANGELTVEHVDHVVAGTGYRVDLDRLTFLDPGLARSLRRTERAPKLSANFESSAPGLYFVGVTAAYGFGPLLRFVCGVEFTARRVAASVAASAKRRTHAADRSPLTAAVEP